MFVASDDPAMKDAMKGVWREKVLTYRDVVQRRNSVEGMRHALRDLYTLGQCSLILTDGNTTFGPLAARYKGTPIENMRGELRRLGPIEARFARATEMLLDRPLRVVWSKFHRLARSLLR